MFQWFRSNASSQRRVERLLLAGLMVFGISLFGQWSGHDVEATSAPTSFPIGDLFPDMNTAEGSFTISPNQGTYTIGTEITLEATGAVDPSGDTDYAFDYWEGLNTADFPNGPGGPGTSAANPLTFTLTNGVPKRGNFFIRYRLQTFTTGQGSVSPSGGWYPFSSILYLVPTPDPGWMFSHWELALSGSQVPGAVILTVPRWVRAVFIPQVTYSLTTTVEGSGTVYLGGSPVSPGVYLAGANVPVTAAPNPGWALHHWEGALGGSVNPSIVTMISNQSVHAVFYPILEFSDVTSSVEESAGIISLPVSLASEVGTQVTVDYAVTGGTAFGNGVDYTLASGSLVFAPNDLDENIAISIHDDSITEVPETVEVTLSNPYKAVLGTQGVHTLTIQDDTTVMFAETSSTVSETDGTGTIEVILSNSPQNPVTVDYSVNLGGSATGDGVDYTLAAGTLNFAQGGTPSADISFQLHDDDVHELLEGIVITLSNPSNADLGTSTSHFLSIESDESTPIVEFALPSSTADEFDGTVEVNVSLSHTSVETIHVDFTLEGTANVSDYTSAPQPPASLSIAPGAMSKLIYIDIINDNQGELDETVILKIVDASIVLAEGGGPIPIPVTVGPDDEHILTIEDDEEPTTVEFMDPGISFSEGYSGTVPANISSSVVSFATLNLEILLDGTGEIGEDFTTSPSMPGDLTFWAAIPYGTIDIDILEDTIDELDETVILQIDTLDSDPYESDIGDVDVFTLTIEDNDPPPTVSFGLASDSVNENHGTYMLNVNLTNPSAFPVKVPFTMIGENNNDYTIMPQNELEIAPGATQGSISIVINDDSMDEVGDYLQITMGDPTAPPLSASKGGPNVFELTIIDNDSAPTVQFLTDVSATVEGDENNLDIQVTLSNTSEENIVVNIGLGGEAEKGPDYTSDLPGNLTIPAGTTMGTGNIVITDDGLHELDETIVLSIDAIVDAGGLGASIGMPNPHIVTIEDDEEAPTVFFDLATKIVDEDVVMWTLDVKLSHQTAEIVTVPYHISGGDATEGATDDFTIDYPTQLIISVGETIGTIDFYINDDDIVESQESVQLTMDTPSTNTFGDLTVTMGLFELLINDNDVPPDVNFTGSEITKTEGNITFDVVATLSRPHSQDITVNLNFADGTATENVDYTRGTLVFPASLITANLQITINDDGINEGDETIIAKIDSPTGLDYAIGTISPTYTITILDNDDAFLAHWPFNGPTLAVMDNDVGGTHMLDLTLGTQASLSSPGIMGDAMLVTPNAQPATVAHRAENGATELDLSSHMTVMTWFKLSGTSTEYTLLSKGDPVNTNTGYEVVVNPTDNAGKGVMFRYGDGVAPQPVNSNQIVFLQDEWYHLGVVFEYGDVNFYINGVLDSTHLGTSSIAANDINFKVGADAADENHFNGFLDELILQNEALAAQDVRDEYEKVTHALTATTAVTEGEIILSRPGGVYFHSEIVQLQAEPESGWTFIDWGGDDASDLMIVNENTANIRMNGAKFISATFEENPIAAFSFTIDELTVSFEDESTGGGGGALVYLWEFGDGTTSDLADPVHTFLQNKPYYVTLTITNVGGEVSDSITHTVNLGDNLQAAIQVEFITATEPYEILLTDVSIPAAGGTINQWTWTLDGDPFPNPNPIVQGPHTVSLDAGSYIVRLDVTQTDLVTDFIEVPIDIGQSPTASFGATPDPQLVGHDVLFTDMSTEGGAEIEQWNWDFGDGTTASGPGPHRHAYTEAMTYDVTLTVRNSFGTSEATEGIEIQLAPTETMAPDFVATITELKVNGVVVLSGSQVKAAESISVTSEVLNDSAFDSPAGRMDALYLSLDETLDENDFQLETQITAGPFAGQGTETVIRGTTGLQDVAPGTYYLIVNVDDDGAIAEVIENNNTATIEIVVVDSELTHE